ncbi:hypothetical protein [Teichococcus coralli]|uniref:hypothetical protein n=1 Tax=Teichococcus coralli TaxID=2545983 RepID=UPI001371C57A|nr:hypothetical protein [Pseudoroseomonas coralli]
MSGQASLPLRPASPTLAHGAPKEDRSIMFRQSEPTHLLFRIASPGGTAFREVAAA